MLFWIGIIFSGLFIWLAIKIGFYEILVMFFNIVISIYVSIFLAPVISDIFPSANETLFYNTFALSVVSIVTFFILYAIAYIILTGQFTITFHKTFEILVAGLIGFLTGFLVFSFAALIITVTPLSNVRIINKIGFNKDSQQTNISYICLWCDIVNKVVSSDENLRTADIIDKIIVNSQIRESEYENTSDTELTQGESIEPSAKDPPLSNVPD